MSGPQYSRRKQNTQGLLDVVSEGGDGRPESCENSLMPFCIATCHACSKPFRLRWRIGKRKVELSQVIRLNCPHCRNQFEIEGVELIVFDAGAESFPITAIVGEPCLVPRK